MALASTYPPVADSSLKALPTDLVDLKTDVAEHQFLTVSGPGGRQPICTCMSVCVCALIMRFTHLCLPHSS